MDKNHIKPISTLKKIWQRVTGREVHRLYRELQATQQELQATQQELQATRYDVTRVIADAEINKNSRENRFHPYVAEALMIAAKSSTIPLTFFSPTNIGPLKGKFTYYGSDKETRHSYAATFSDILTAIDKPRILEIGLGSLNGYPYAGLPPGGSIKAWRSAYPSALIVGADIDKAAVDSIFVRQASQYAPFDLIVDDGFHDPHANLRTLIHVFPLTSDGGAYVIEDVHVSMVNLWRLLSQSVDGDLEIRDLSAERPNTNDNILLIFRKKRVGN